MLCQDSFSLSRTLRKEEESTQEEVMTSKREEIPSAEATCTPWGNLLVIADRDRGTNTIQCGSVRTPRKMSGYYSPK